MMAESIPADICACLSCFGTNTKRDNKQCACIKILILRLKGSEIEWSANILASEGNFVVKKKKKLTYHEPQVWYLF